VCGLATGAIMKWYFVLAILLGPAASSATPVQWAIEDGGNGHWYEWRNSWQWSWTLSLEMARDSYHDGVRGNLVTFSNATEEDWVRSHVVTNHFPIWIGGHCFGPPYNWGWVTGEPIEYENWAGFWNTPPSSALTMIADGWGTNGTGATHTFVVEYSSADAIFEQSIGIEDSPGDQGGALAISWFKSVDDAPSLADSVSAYQVERLEGDEWAVLLSIESTHATSYAATVATDDVYVVGQPPAWSLYRVRALTSNPTTSYCTVADSAYSIDNLPPAAPQLALYDTETSRALAWTPDSVPDARETCLYRDFQPGFEAGDLTP
jgi:hypothetical protein